MSIMRQRHLLSIIIILREERHLLSLLKEPMSLSAMEGSGSTWKTWPAMASRKVDVFGKRVYPRTTRGWSMSRLDAFLMMHPPTQLELQIELTNENLAKGGHREVTKGEKIKFMGIWLMMMISCYHCHQHRDLWDTKTDHKYMDAAVNFAKFGMPRHCFELVCAVIFFLASRGLRKACT